jgi:hypothetical protein
MSKRSDPGLGSGSVGLDVDPNPAKRCGSDRRNTGTEHNYASCDFQSLLKVIMHTGDFQRAEKQRKDFTGWKCNYKPT